MTKNGTNHQSNTVTPDYTGMSPIPPSPPPGAMIPMSDPVQMQLAQQQMQLLQNQLHSANSVAPQTLPISPGIARNSQGNLYMTMMVPRIAQPYDIYPTHRDNPSRAQGLLDELGYALIQYPKETLGTFGYRLLKWGAISFVAFLVLSWLWSSKLSFAGPGYQKPDAASSVMKALPTVSFEK